jgi:hypothetical protein
MGSQGETAAPSAIPAVDAPRCDLQADGWLKLIHAPRPARVLEHWR